MKAWKIGAIIGLIWGFFAIMLYLSPGAEPDNNPQTGEIEMFHGDNLDFFIFFIPFLLASWIFLIIVPLSDILPSFISMALIMMSMLFSTSLVLGGIGYLVDKYRSKK